MKREALVMEGRSGGVGLNARPPLPDTVLREEDLDAAIARLEMRKAKLEKIAGLEQEVAQLEYRKLNGDAKFILEANVITRVVCAATRVSPLEVAGRGRTAEICRARFIIWLLLRELFAPAYAALGRMFHREHGAVMNGIATLRDEMGNCPRTRAQVAGITRQCVAELQAAGLLEDWRPLEADAAGGG